MRRFSDLECWIDETSRWEQVDRDEIADDNHDSADTMLSFWLDRTTDEGEYRCRIVDEHGTELECSRTWRSPKPRH